jgi:transcriptional regulator with XRE-family HTH domain
MNKTAAEVYMKQQLAVTADRVHQARRKRGLTQKELARQCGFPYQVINRVEGGHQDVYAQRLALIADTLGVSTDYLLGLTDKAGGET